MYSIYNTVNLNSKKNSFCTTRVHEFLLLYLHCICQCLFIWQCYLLCFLLDQWSKWLLPLRDVLLAGYYGITADNGICLLLDALLEEKVAVLLRENGRQKRLKSEKNESFQNQNHLSFWKQAKISQTIQSKKFKGC